MGSGSSRHAPPSSSSSSYPSSSHPPLSTLPSASRHPRLPPSPSARRKRRVLAPFLRSFSCGTSSSAWRAESFVDEDQVQDADLLTCRNKKPVTPDMNASTGLSISSRGKGVDVEINNNHTLASDLHSSDDVCTSNASKLLVTASASGSSCSAGSNTYFSQRSRNEQREYRETEKNPVLRTHRHTSSRDNSNTRVMLEIGSADTSCLVESTSEQSELVVPSLAASRSFSEDLEIRPDSDTNSLGINGDAMSTGTLPVFEAHRTALPLEAAPGGNNNLGREEAARIVPTRGATAANQSENMGLLHVDALGLVSQSSDESPSISRGEASGREARRNNRRRLWDALTRATSRRRTFSSAFLVASEEIDGLGPWNDGWGLFDWSSSDEGGESGFVGSRSSEMAERRRSRPQVWALQHFSSSMEGAPVHSRHCAIGRHPNGRCSCEAFVMTEETSTRASISRIVMLAEALFEVLDEIHRQSVALSRSTSLSLVSLPAPEAVVDSFPIRIHKKNAKLDGVAEESVECYICLVEYEDGDKVRTLPCCHEFHMCCVDKWLKEVHRVCPLCRGNVCDATPGSSQVAVV